MKKEALTYYQAISMVEGKMLEMEVLSKSAVQVVNYPNVTYCFDGGSVQVNRITHELIVKEV